MYLIFDTETTGLPRNWKLDYTHSDNWPRAVQIAWQLHDELGNLIEAKDYLIRPDGFNVPYDAEQVHGISTQLAQEAGESLEFVLQEFHRVCDQAQFVVGHNVGFDINVMSAEYYRVTAEKPFLQDKKILDTCTEKTAGLCKIPGGRGGGFKLPTLTELNEFLFQESFAEAHNATADVEATTRCFLELIRTELFYQGELGQDDTYFQRYQAANKESIRPIGLKHLNLKEASRLLRSEVKNVPQQPTSPVDISNLKNIPFAHLHNHTQFSILQSTTNLDDLISLTSEMKMPAVALTDNGNMMGAFHFEEAVSKYNKKIKAEKAAAEEAGTPYDKQPILPIIGCEFNVCRDRKDKTIKDNGYQIVLLAKNKKGYQNLVKLASAAYTEGMYYVPRVDKEIIEKYKSDIIVLSGGVMGEIPQLILNVGEVQAEEALLWWKQQFGEDFYLEVMRHGQEDENHINSVLVQFSQKHDVKIVATNNTYYPRQKDADTHDLLLCLRDNELQSTPIGRGRGFRYGFANQNYYYRSADEMRSLFSDLPQALENVGEIIAKIEPYQLGRDVLLPAFEIPEEFQDEKDKEDGGKRGENNYLRHLTYEGAKKRYSEITEEIQSRLDFELKTIENTGYPGYFLIVQDFCQAARDMGVSVGPGRGSAAGSAVAYCIGITNVDPIKYDLLFERFLNPDRVSMPDIDIDFDDEGRGKVIEWVIQKYGSNQVSQISTWGTMAAKSSIRDTARVLDLPLYEADKIAKLIPDLSLNKIFKLSDEELRNKLKNKQESIDAVNQLKQIYSEGNLSSKVINQAVKLEGTIRNTGIHACGVIITPDDITNYVPVALAKDSSMWCTQFENSVVEKAGLLKMDFLGLRTLTIIKHAVRNVQLRHGKLLDPDTFPIDDEKTYELFQRGETIGIFQYESGGMQKYMRELKPTVFADLIAMNALYRPGPIEYIPDFIERKNGKQAIVYDLDASEEYLKETYGITVYQEQVMLLSQKLANFTKGEADVLRKAMGKKQKDVLDKMKPQFIEQASSMNGHPVPVLEKIWKDWEAFASYAFNKSHSTCYAWIAYQTAYLKANYPAEFMASVLSNNMSDIKEVSLFMEECKRMGIEVLGPDVNESSLDFTVNKTGAIRFGMGAIKGLGSSPVEAIISEREENGNYSSVFDFVRRVNLRNCNKKALESLSLAGGFDSFNAISRAQLFKEDTSGKSFIETLIRYGNSYQENLNSAQNSLFGEGSSVDMPEPVVPKTEDWPTLFQLNKEKEVIGIFISGHPLDDYKVEIEAFGTGNVTMLEKPHENLGREVLITGIITESTTRMSKNNTEFGIITIEDYEGSFKLFVFGDTFTRFRPYFYVNSFVAIRGKFEIPKFRKEPEFVIHHIDQLQRLKEQATKKILLKIFSQQVNQLFIGNLKDVLETHTGGCPVVMQVYDDMEQENTVTLNSRKLGVDLSKDLFDKLKKMDVEFGLKG